MTHNNGKYSFLWKVDKLEYPKSVSHRFYFRLLWCSAGLIVFLLFLFIVKYFHPEIENNKWLIIASLPTGLTIALPIISLLLDRKIKQLNNTKKSV